MRVTFLGTAASEGYPTAFCSCRNCVEARRLGGPSLRKRSSLLINQDLLIDMGPDLMAASMQHGVSLAEVRYCLQTHAHEDHLDPSHFSARLAANGIPDAPLLEFYGGAASIARAARAAGIDGAQGSANDTTPASQWRLALRRVAAGQTFRAGPYTVTAVTAAHDPESSPLLYAITDGKHTLFYGTDTGALPDESWRVLLAGKWRFAAVILDHTFGLAQARDGHMNREQFLEQVRRMRQEQLLLEGVLIYAQHLAHHSNPAHPELATLAEADGYRIACDGLCVDLDQALPGSVQGAG